MTVKEIREQLAPYPDDMDVFLEAGKTEFAFSLLNSVRKGNIILDEGIPNREPFTNIDCVVLSEE